MLLSVCILSTLVLTALFGEGWGERKKERSDLGTSSSSSFSSSSCLSLSLSLSLPSAITSLPPSLPGLCFQWYIPSRYTMHYVGTTKYLFREITRCQQRKNGKCHAVPYCKHACGHELQKLPFKETTHTEFHTIFSPKFDFIC